MKFLLHLTCLFLTIPCLGKQYAPVDNVHTQYYSMRQKKKLFKNVGCKYINKMEIEYLDFSNMQPNKTEYYKNAAEIIDANSMRYKKQIQEWHLAPMYLKWISSDIGHGVFAMQDIKKGDFIGAYAGEVRIMRLAEEIPAEDVDYAWYYPINALNDKKLLIDGKYCGNELRFINHAVDPNTKCMDLLVDGIFYLCYVATKNIARDEELTVDYGCGYWDSRGVRPA